MSSPHISPASVSHAVKFQLSASVSHSLPYPQLSPAEDSYLATQYTARSIAQRKKNQVALRELLKVDNHLPIVGIMVGSFDLKAEKLLVQLVEACSALPLQLVLLATTKQCLVAKDATLKQLVPSDRQLHLFWGAADMLLLAPESDDGLVAACFRYGLVPILHHNQSLVRDYDPVSEEGNAFVYTESNIWSMYAALVRAMETYKLPYDWQRIQRNGIDMAA